MKRLLFFAALVVAAFSVVIGSAAAGGAPVKASVVYNSIPASSPSNLPSVGAEAYAFTEFGNEINLGGSARHLSSVTVTLSSWGCVSGNWYTDTSCSTPAGDTFPLTLTLNIYNPSNTINPIATSTQTFAVPYRPSASSKCTGGQWYQSSPKMCFNGLADNVTFTFPGSVTLPNTVVYGIAYNTTHYGLNPIGEGASCFGTTAGCPYDSLNIALVTKPADVGSETNPGTVWQNSPSGSQYCDGGTAGTGTFRLDSPTSACWAPYLPAVQFKAGS